MRRRAAPPAALERAGRASRSLFPIRRKSLSSVLSSVSTDNHYFAARSVGKNGKRSIAVAAVAAVRRPPGYVSMEAPRVTPPPVTIPSGPPVK